jgi:hypothetical protein
MRGYLHSSTFRNIDSRHFGSTPEDRITEVYLTLIWSNACFDCLLLRLGLPLFQSQLGSPRTILHHLKIALNPVAAELVRVRAFTAPGEHPVFVARIVEFRVIGQQNGSPGGGGFSRDVLLRVDVGLKILDPGIWGVVHEIEGSTA